MHVFWFSIYTKLYLDLLYNKETREKKSFLDANLLVLHVKWVQLLHWSQDKASSSFVTTLSQYVQASIFPLSLSERLKRNLTNIVVTSTQILKVGWLISKSKRWVYTYIGQCDKSCRNENIAHRWQQYVKALTKICILKACNMYTVNAHRKYDKSCLD